MLRNLSHSLPCAFALLAVAAPLSARAQTAPNPLLLLSHDNPALAYSDITFTAHLGVAPLPEGTFYLSIGSAMPVIMTPNRSGSSAIYTTSSLGPGTYPVTATFTLRDGSTPYTSTISEVVTAATGDFTLAGLPSVFAVRNGLTASGLISATSVNDFHGPVSFSCSLPENVDYTCALSPSDGTLTLNSYAASTITLAPTVAPIAFSRHPGRLHDTSRVLLASLSLLSLAAFGGRRRRTHLHGLLCFAVLTLLAFSAATPPGTYPVTITATGTTPGEPPITHTLNITLNVTQ
jgi:hypothetical protein